MKKVLNKIRVTGACLLLVSFGCSDSDEPSVQSGSLENYDAIISSLQQLEDFGFTDTDNTVNGNGAARVAQDSECYTFEFAEEEDGSTTLVYDFGESCTLESSTLSGKLTINFTMDEELNYSQVTVYEEFSIDALSLNGSETQTGSFEVSGEFGESFDFNSQVATSKDLTLVGCDGETYTYSSSRASTTTFDGETVTALEEVLRQGEISYTTTLESDLYFDFGCLTDETTTYTEGVIRTVSGDEERIIDYGDGTCDNLVLVTENGETSEQDISELSSEQTILCES